MKAVILAGGLGSRLRPFTEVIPKPLLPLGENSLMETQILMLKSFGFDDIHIATNYMADYVEAYLGDGSKFGVDLHFSREEEPLGTCGPLSLLQAELTEPFLMMNGDILTKADLRAIYDYAWRAEQSLTVATKIISTPFRFSNVTVNAEGLLTGFEEKPEFKIEVLAGIYCMNPDVLQLIPPNQFFGIDTLIKKMLSRKIEISRYLIKEYWLDIGQIEDYTVARKEYARHFKAS